MELGAIYLQIWDGLPDSPISRKIERLYMRKIFVIFSLLFFYFIFMMCPAKGATMGNVNFENQIREKCKKIDLKNGVTKEEATIIAQNELLNSKYKDNFDITKPNLSYDKEYKTWGVEFKPKKNFKNDINWGVLINEKTGEVYSGSLTGL
jgi:hypothetical protein